MVLVHGWCVYVICVVCVCLFVCLFGWLVGWLVGLVGWLVVVGCCCVFRFVVSVVRVLGSVVCVFRVVSVACGLVSPSSFVSSSFLSSLSSCRCCVVSLCSVLHALLGAHTSME